MKLFVSRENQFDFRSLDKTSCGERTQGAVLALHREHQAQIDRAHTRRNDSRAECRTTHKHRPRKARSCGASRESAGLVHGKFDNEGNRTAGTSRRAIGGCLDSVGLSHANKATPEAGGESFLFRGLVRQRNHLAARRALTSVSEEECPGGQDARTHLKGDNDAETGHNEPLAG